MPALDTAGHFSAFSGMLLCPVCLSLAATPPTTGDFSQFDCPICGTDKISGSALAILKPRVDELDCTKLSALIREIVDSTAPETPLLDSDTIEGFIAATEA